MKNKSKNKSVITHDHPGRPRYEMKFPRSAEWTFTQLMAANGVCTDKNATMEVPSKRKNGKPRTVNLFGKGPKCSLLTLRKNLEHDMYLHVEGKPCISKYRTRVNPRSMVVEVKGVTAEPDSESGLGRRAGLFRLRSVPAKDHADDKAPSKAPRKVSIKTTVAETIEAAKAILAEPAAVVTIAPAPAPVEPVIPVAPAPVAEVPAPAPAPEVEVNLANETVAAPVAEPVAA